MWQIAFGFRKSRKKLERERHGINASRASARRPSARRVCTRRRIGSDRIGSDRIGSDRIITTTRATDGQRRTDGQTERRTDRRTDGRTDGQRRRDGRRDGQADRRPGPPPCHEHGDALCKQVSENWPWRRPVRACLQRHGNIIYDIDIYIYIYIEREKY